MPSSRGQQCATMARSPSQLASRHTRILPTFAGAALSTAQQCPSSQIRASHSLPVPYFVTSATGESYRGRGAAIDTTGSSGKHSQTTPPQKQKCPSTSRPSAAARPATTPSKRLRPASPRRPYRKRKRGAASSRSKRPRSTGLKDFAGSRPASLGGRNRLEMIQGCEDGNAAA